MTVKVSEDLHVKYRPETLDEVFGQKLVVDSIKELFKKNKVPHCFVFTGGSGLGKTTLARIVAKMVGCTLTNIIEVDGAEFTGVDSIRELKEYCRYAGMGESKNKFIIIDEFHKLSSSAVDCLLKIIEEPPPFLYFAFCTTESNKIKKTVQTRSHLYNLKEVSQEELFELLCIVTEQEDINLSDEILSIIAQEALGSPRQVLVYLSKCRGCTTKEQVLEMLESPLESREIIDLCRVLVKSASIRTSYSWDSFRDLIKELKDKDAESVRIVICNYLNACILKSNNPKNLLIILRKFDKPFYKQTKSTDLLLAISKIVFNI